MGEVTPIFLFSIQRSGSTLVQRVLGAHKDIATAAEPWLLLPLMYTLKDKGVYVEYSHRALRMAIDDLCVELGGRQVLLDEIAAMALRIYERLANGRRYFLDKTPRYHFIVEEIIDAFPNAKLVFLWRNPLAAAASMTETWADGRWNLYRFRHDLERGVPSLVDAHMRHAKRSIALRYEDLVTGAHEPWRDLFTFLDLEFDPALLESFTSTKLRGKMKDPTGTIRYQTLSRDSLDSWKTRWGQPLRRRWARSLISHIGDERLSHMGYSGPDLRASLAAAPITSQHLLTDLVRRSYGVLYERGSDFLFSEPAARLRRLRRRFSIGQME